MVESLIEKLKGKEFPSDIEIGTASYHPPYIIINQELFNYYRRHNIRNHKNEPVTDPDKFFDLSHIEERCYTQPLEADFADPEETVPTMGALVLEQALREKNWQLEDLDYLLVTTTFPLNSSVAELVYEKVQRKELSATNPPRVKLLELYGGCSGFVMCLDYIKQHEAEFVGKKIATVASEQLSVHVRGDPDSFLFADGAGTLVGIYGKDFKILGSAAQCFPEKAHHLKVRFKEPPKVTWSECIDYVSMPPPPPDYPSDVKMDGHAVYEYAIGDDNFRTVLEACEKAGIKIEDFKHTLDHQANGRIVDANYRKLEKNGYKGPHYKNIQRYGNTASASVPTLLHEFKQEIKAGEPTLMWDMGAGLISAAAIVSFGKSTEDQKAFPQAA